MNYDRKYSIGIGKQWVICWAWLWGILAELITLPAYTPCTLCIIAALDESQSNWVGCQEKSCSHLKETVEGNGYMLSAKLKMWVFIAEIHVTRWLSYEEF